VERVELEKDGIYQVQDSLHHWKYILYFQGKYIKKSQRLTVTATTDLFLVTLQSAVLEARSAFTVTLHLAERTPLIPATAYLVLLHLRSVGILCRVCRITRRHTWTVSHPQLWPTPAPTKSRGSVRIACAIVVLNSTNNSNQGNFKLSNEFANTFCL